MRLARLWIRCSLAAAQLRIRCATWGRLEEAGRGWLSNVELGIELRIELRTHVRSYVPSYTLSYVLGGLLNPLFGCFLLYF